MSDTSHVTRHTSHVTRHTSHVTRQMLRPAQIVCKGPHRSLKSLNAMMMMLLPLLLLLLLLLLLPTTTSTSLQQGAAACATARMLIAGVGAGASSSQAGTTRARHWSRATWLLPRIVGNANHHTQHASNSTGGHGRPMIDRHRSRGDGLVLAPALWATISAGDCASGGCGGAARVCRRK